MVRCYPCYKDGSFDEPAECYPSQASLHDGKCRAEEELHRVQDTYTAYQRTTNMKVNQLERKIAELTQALHSRDSALQSMESKHKLSVRIISEIVDVIDLSRKFPIRLQLQSANTQCDEMLSQVEKAEANNREMAAIIVQLRSELATANEQLARCRADLAEKARLSEDLHAQVCSFCACCLCIRHNLFVLRCVIAVDDTTITSSKRRCQRSRSKSGVHISYIYA